MSACRIPVLVSCLVLVLESPAGGTEPPLDVESYIAIVLRSNPATDEISGLEAAAEAERKAARLFPDPAFEFSWDRARPTEATGTEETETAFAFSQTIPWPGTFAAGIRASDRAGDARRAEAEGLRWELAARARAAFARLEAARSLSEIARAAEEDARSLRDLVAHRADLGESRESDRIRTTVEWLKQERNRAAAERFETAADVMLRVLAVAPLPRPVQIQPTAPPSIVATNREDLRASLAEKNPRARVARAEAERQMAAASVARRGRIPDLAVTVFRQDEIDKEATGLSFGIRLPLWNASRGEIARAEAAAQVSGAEARRVLLEVESELESRIAELETAVTQVSLFDREILPAARKSVGLARFGYQEGETSLLDLLDAQRTLRDAEREAVDAKFTLALSLAEVQRLLGPSFTPWRPVP